MKFNLFYPVRGAITWMTISAILDGICGLLLIPVVFFWSSHDYTSIYLMAAVSCVYFLCSFVAVRKGFSSGGSIVRTLALALCQHLPNALKPVPAAGGLLSGAVMQGMSIPAHLLLPIINAVVTPLTVIIALMFFDFTLAFTLLFSCILLVVILRWSAKQTAQFEAKKTEDEQEVIIELENFALHQPLLRRAGKDHQLQNSLSHSLVEQFNSQRRLQRQSLPYHLLFSLGVQIFFIGVLAAGAWMTSQQNLHPALWLGLMLLIARMIEPLWLLSHLDQALRQAQQALTQINQALSTAELAYSSSNETPKSNSISCVNIIDETETQRRLLDQITLDFAENSFTAIVGPSGAGKSSLLNILARLKDPLDGQVYYGDKPVIALSKQVLAQQRGLLLQDNRLFRGSLRQNLLAGANNIDDRQIMALLAKLNLMLPEEQLSADVGPSGDFFSGGQKQRLCIARLLLADPDIIMMDEPTASLDQTNASSVIELISTLSNKTRIVVTHNPKLANCAENIVIMNEGVVEDYGSPQQLMARNDWYQQFITSHEENPKPSAFMAK